MPSAIRRQNIIMYLDQYLNKQRHLFNRRLDQQLRAEIAVVSS